MLIPSCIRGKTESLGPVTKRWAISISGRPCLRDQLGDHFIRHRGNLNLLTVAPTSQTLAQPHPNAWPLIEVREVLIQSLEVSPPGTEVKLEASNDGISAVGIEPQRLAPAGLVGTLATEGS